MTPSHYDFTLVQRLPIPKEANSPKGYLVLHSRLP